jgi:hypothetical protein
MRPHNPYILPSLPKTHPYSYPAMLLCAVFSYCRPLCSGFVIPEKDVEPLAEGEAGFCA